MKCSACGEENASNARFCSFCGARLTAPADEDQTRHDPGHTLPSSTAKPVSDNPRGGLPRRRAGPG